MAESARFRKYAEIAHCEDNASSSCIIKQEPEGEGIYASAACSESRDPKTDQGLTLPPKIQSKDPWISSTARSTIDDEIDALLGFEQVDLLENEARRDDSWAITLFEDEYQLSEPPRKKQKLTELPVPDPNQGAKSASRTPSPSQSDCLGSISQTSARSETPQTPSEPEHAVAIADTCAHDDQGQILSGRGQLQHTLAADVKHGSLRAEVNHAARTPAVTEVVNGPKEVSPDPPVSGPNVEASRPKSTQRITTWDADAPIASIEVDLHQSRVSRDSVEEPSLSARRRTANAKANSVGLKDASSSSASIDAGEKRKHAAGQGKTSECEQQRKRGNTVHKSSTPCLNHTTSKIFCTFMNLRNSLPVSAIMAMLLPPQRKELLQTLAELFNAQNWISRSGVTQSVAHELPENLRAILKQIKSKFQGDEQFRKSLILYIAEDLKDTYEAKGTKRVSMDDILRIGIDELKTLDESKQQLLYERKHYHGLLVDMDGEISVQKDRIQQLEAEIRFLRSHNPHLPSTTTNASTSSLLGTSQLELENGVPKCNPFWVCRLMLLDGSCVQCHGMNQEWHQLHKPGRAEEWTRRTLCFRCGRRNKSNRTYLSDIEVKMLGRFTKTGRINPYGNKSRSSQQGPSRQASSPAAQPHVINSPPLPVKNLTPVYMSFPPVSTPQPAQQLFTVSQKSQVKSSANPCTGNPSANIPQPSVLRTIPYENLPTLFTKDSYEPVWPANIPVTRGRTATTNALTFPAIGQDAFTHPFQPVLPASVSNMDVCTVTTGVLRFSAADVEPLASPGLINSPGSEIPDSEPVDFSKWMGITTTPGNGTNSHIQHTQQFYGSGQDILLQAAAQRVHGNSRKNYLRAAQPVYYIDSNNHLQAAQQNYGNGTSNQIITGKKRPATTPPKSDLPSPQKAKFHRGFNVTNSTQETLQLQLQGVQKPWMSRDFAKVENDEEPCLSANGSLFGERDDVGSTLEELSSLSRERDDEGFPSESLYSLFNDNEGYDTLRFENAAVDTQGRDSQYSGSDTMEGTRKSKYEIDCKLFGFKYANERREKEADEAVAKETGQSEDSDVDLDAQLEADLMAALDDELGY